jgi:hypothetical protein
VVAVSPSASDSSFNGVTLTDSLGDRSYAAVEPPGGDNTKPLPPGPGGSFYDCLGELDLTLEHARGEPLGGLALAVGWIACSLRTEVSIVVKLQLWDAVGREWLTMASDIDQNLFGAAAEAERACGGEGVNTIWHAEALTRISPRRSWKGPTATPAGFC